MPLFDPKPLHKEQTVAAGCTNKLHDNSQLAEMFDPPTEIPSCMMCKQSPVGEWFCAFGSVRWFSDPEEHHLRCLVHVGRSCRRTLNDPLDVFYRIFKYDGRLSVVTYVCRGCLGKHGKDVERVLLEAGVVVPGVTDVS